MKHYDYANLPWEDQGNRWEVAVVHLSKDETAWRPGSTRHVIYGPATVTYERHPSGITAYVE